MANLPRGKQLTIALGNKRLRCLLVAKEAACFKSCSCIANSPECNRQEVIQLNALCCSSPFHSIAAFTLFPSFSIYLPVLQFHRLKWKCCLPLFGLFNQHHGFFLLSKSVWNRKTKYLFLHNPGSQYFLSERESCFDTLHMKVTSLLLGW